MKVWIRSFHHQLNFGNEFVENIFIDILGAIERYIKESLISYDLDWETVVYNEDEYEQIYNKYWEVLEGIDKYLRHFVLEHIHKKYNVRIYFYDVSDDYYRFIILLSLKRITNELFRLLIEIKVDEADDLVFINMIVNSTTIVFEKPIDFNVLVSEMELDRKLWEIIMLTITDPNLEQEYNLNIQFADIESEFYSPQFNLQLDPACVFLS